MESGVLPIELIRSSILMTAASGVTIPPDRDVAHLIQTALTPVFLLSGIGTLLSVFNARLARVSDHLSHVAELLLGTANPDQEHNLRRHLARYGRRMWLLDASIALAGIGGAATCGAACVLFLGSVGNVSVAVWLISLFSTALACTVAALMAFLGDSIMAWHGLRQEGPLPRAVRNSLS